MMAVERGRRPGLGTIELVVSLALLSMIFLTLGGVAARYAQGQSLNESRAIAIRLANERLEAVRGHRCYDELATRFQGTELDVEGIADTYRRTRVTRRTDTVDGGVADVTLVSVEVFVPGLPEPIERTVTLRGP